MPSASSDIQAIIFDCDGVLVDSEYLKFLAWKEAFAKSGVDFVLEEYMPLVGHSSQEIFRVVKEKEEWIYPKR